MELQLKLSEAGCRKPEPITARDLLPPAQPSCWSAEELAVMEQPIDQGSRFLAWAHGGRNMFLTGMAGTGKSWLLRRFISESARRVSVTAPTGVAALNVGGMTLHRFCGMRLGPRPGQSDEAFYRELKEERHPAVMAGFRRVRNCEVLVIDEVSMLPGRILNFVDFLFCQERGCDAAFGGCQVIATGDFLQLPPVRTAGAVGAAGSESQPYLGNGTAGSGRRAYLTAGSESQPYLGNGAAISAKQPYQGGYDWAFRSEAWERAEFKTIVLEEVKRQDDPEFVRALSNFRRGRIWGEDARLLQSRIRNFPPANLTRLFTHNVQVDKWNNFQLSELRGEPVILEARTQGPEPQVEFLRKNLLTPSTLVLKPGALVMFTVNRSERGKREPVFVNGQLGVIEKCEVRGANSEVEDQRVWVRVKGGEVIPVEPFTWEFDRNDPGCGRLTQYPLRLAYAMTIHKAQGLTLDAAYLDIRAAREPGQAYVAVSRVRTLAGLHFKDWFKGVWVDEEALKFYGELQRS